MFIPKEFDKYTNYNNYVVNPKYSSRVEITRLYSLIKKLISLFDRPYIRFMWMSGKDGKDDSAMCVIYSDMKKGERITKLVSFEDAELQVGNYRKKTAKKA